MKTLLRIDSSSRTSGSYSRKLADYFEEVWRRNTNAGRVIYRDLARTILPHLHSKTIEGFYTPTEQMDATLAKATTLSDELISEIKSADEVLISSPLYNLTVPSNLKAYIDHIVRIGHTFKVDQNGSHGLFSGIKTYIITAKGGVMKGTEMEKYDFQEPYLAAILGYMGIHIERLFSLEGTAREDLVEENTKQVLTDISEYFIKRHENGKQRENHSTSYELH
ncbi:MAG: NAD(P)H-dependent oxidoreductase [Bacteroidota bacterium]